MADARDESPRFGWQRLLQVGVTAIALYLMFRLVDLGAAARVLTQASPGLVGAAIVLYLGAQALSAFRWWSIGLSVGLGGGFVEYLRFYLIGMFFMFFGPSTLGGDLVRSLYLAEGSGRRARAFNSVLFDRVNGLVILIAIGAAAFLLYPDYGLPLPLLYVTVAAGASLVLGWWLAPTIAALCLPAGHRLRRFIEDDLGPFWRDRGMLVRVSAVSVLFHMVQIGTQFLVARALGLDIPFSYICVFHPLVSALSAIPITLSGVGLREGGYLFFLVHYGVDRESALAFGMLWLVVIIANSLVGGLVFLASGARLPTLRDTSTP